MKQLSVVIISHSAILANGCAAMMTQAYRHKLSTRIVSPADDWLATLVQSKPDIVITDPLSLSPESLEELRAASPKHTIVAGVYTSALPSSVSSGFDTTISIFASLAAFESLIEKAGQKSESADRESAEELTPREREIIIGVVRGLTNKEIAASLNVSVHTVMTHRRNISNKLQIHSPAGLTIYAIVKKLIPVEDLNLTGH